MRHGSGQTVARRKSRVAGAMGCWLVLLLVTIGALVLTHFSHFSVASCSTACDYAAFRAAMFSFYVAAVVVLFAPLAGIYFLRGRGWLAVAAPVLGIVLLAVAFVVTYSLGRSALGLPLF